MAAPTTVLQFVMFQTSELNDALSKAQSALTAKQTAYTAAQTALTSLQAQLATTATDMTSIRNALMGSVTPEDGAALLVKLAADIDISRTLTGKIAQAQRQLAVAKADADVATSEVQRLTTALAASNAALADAQTKDKRRGALKASLASPPLATIATDAATLAGSATFTAAKTRLTTDLSAELQAEAETRFKDERDRAKVILDQAEQAQILVEAQWAADGGVAGKVLAAQSALERADAKFTNYVTTAANRFAAATAALTNVADPTFAALSPAQKAGILDNTATVVSNAKTSAGLEKTVDDAVLALTQNQEALALATWKAQQANIDADPSTDAAVITAKKNAKDAQDTLTTAQNAYTPAAQQQAATWAVLVPDSEWQLVAAFETASDTLDWLQNPSGTALQTALETAEQALATALLAADKSIRTIALLKTFAAKFGAIADYEVTAADNRRFSAVRGDF